MLSKAELKYLNALQIKKYRSIHQAFLVEGAKSVRELLSSDFEIDKLFITDSFYSSHTTILNKGFTYQVIPEKELVRAGTFATNNAALAVAKIKKPVLFDSSLHPFTIALDDIRDPGNLGTIIRIADWYGIKHLVCSPTCADFYNPKVIAATMGSFTRVTVSYEELPPLLKRLPTAYPVYGADMEGENIHKLHLKPAGVLVMGNEANGLTPPVAACIKKLIKIPGFGATESLNVATATGIIIDNFFRNVSS